MTAEDDPQEKWANLQKSLANPNDRREAVLVRARAACGAPGGITGKPMAAMLPCMVGGPATSPPGHYQLLGSFSRVIDCASMARTENSRCQMMTVLAYNRDWMWYSDDDAGRIEEVLQVVCVETLDTLHSASEKYLALLRRHRKCHRHLQLIVARRFRDYPIKQYRWRVHYEYRK
jgi:hypothetical protein